MLDKPSQVFGRADEWDDLNRFAFRDTPGLRIGIVRGRRRTGKSFLLRQLADLGYAHYVLARRQSPTAALNSFEAALVRSLGWPPGPFTDWMGAFERGFMAIDTDRERCLPLLVIDEFPYWVETDSALPSVIQAIYDQLGPTEYGHPSLKLILCGSALSLMSSLLAGNQPLRGRAVLDLRLGPFDFRDAATYWDVDVETAFGIDAVLGGAPGYRDATDRLTPEPGDDGLYNWLARTVLHPSHSLFNEPEYLLAEDPWVGDQGRFRWIWDAVARGASTPTKIGALTGLDSALLDGLLTIMRDGGYLREEQDMLARGRPVIRIADPIVRFHHLIVQPNLDELQRRDARAVWEAERHTFTAKILGPHFEDLARIWVRRYGREERDLHRIGPVGSAQIACRAHRGHEVDVVGVDRDSPAHTRDARVVLLGEAKYTAAKRSAADLERLEHIREVLLEQGYDAAGTEFALFSRTGFEPELHAAEAAGRVHLLDLPTMYGSATHATNSTKLRPGSPEDRGSHRGSRRPE